ncbi:MAG: hypothetical protein NT028_08375, partial [candidate division Zixibacteria bacterium]|nr:hypothetical protein [candidate division Zixibacteria bacterium]
IQNNSTPLPKDFFNSPQVVGHPSHIKACQPDGMYLTARAATDSLTTAKYEYVLGHNGYCSASH